jgi:hypothetical protein
MNQKLQMKAKNVFAVQPQVAEGLWFRRADGVMLKTTGRSAPLFYDWSWRARVFKHEVVVFDGDFISGSNNNTYFTNLDVHTEVHFTAQILGSEGLSILDFKAIHSRHFHIQESNSRVETKASPQADQTTCLAFHPAINSKLNRGSTLVALLETETK